jgi:glycosyltransferase involved in cell wall biosynthesis
MTRPVVYFAQVPYPHLIAEFDRLASGLGLDAVRLVFNASRLASASWPREMFPEVCRYHVVNGTPKQNPLALADIPQFLTGLNPELLISYGWRPKTCQAALHWAYRNRRPYCLRSDNNIWADRFKGFPRYLLRKFRLRRPVRHAHSCLLTGENNRPFWQRYGMTAEQEGWWPQWLDYDHFAKARLLRRQSRDELRRELGIRSELNLVHVGRLVRLKKVPILCEALLRADQRVGLVLVGNGDQEPVLRSRYGDRLGDRLKFAGGIAPAELPKWYAATDILVLASGAREHWGMVLNEACISGMPVICNRRVGAVPHLLEDGRNGLALESDDVESWVRAIDTLAADADLRARMGERSVELANAWRARSDPVECIRAVLDSNPKYRP